MNLEITTPDKTIFEGEVSLVQLPGIDGSFELLNNHAPMISALKKGKIKIKDKGNNIRITTPGPIRHGTRKTPANRFRPV